MSPDGRTIAYMTKDSIVLRSLDPGGSERHMGDLNSTINSIAFSPDGSRLACVGNLGFSAHAFLWDLRTDKPAVKLPRNQNAERPQGFEFDVVFADAGRRLIVSGSSSTRAWDAVAGKPAGTFKDESRVAKGIALSKDGRSYIQGASAPCNARREYPESIPRRTLFPRRDIRRIAEDHHAGGHSHPGDRVPSRGEPRGADGWRSDRSLEPRNRSARSQTRRPQVGGG